MDGTLTFDIDYMVFVAPNPQQADKFFALIYPLDMTVWLLILISFFGATFSLVVIALIEEMVIINNKGKMIDKISNSPVSLDNQEKVENLEFSWQMLLVHIRDSYW